MKTADASRLCDSLGAVRIESVAMADFDDTTLSWVTVYEPSL